MADAKAGTAKSVSTSITLTGSRAGNYSLTQPSGVTVNINKASLAPKNAVVSDKTYNGSKSATVTGIDFDGLISGESLASGVDFTASGLFDSADMGDDIPVTVTVSLAGTDAAGNYTLSSTTASTTADITPKAITISGVAATNRAYDGTSSVALTGGALSGVETADTGSVDFDLGTGAMADAKAGDAKPVSTGITLMGSKAGNYSLTQPTGITADIAKASLTPKSAVVSNKTYSGNKNATVTGVAFDGLVSGESLVFGTDYTASGVFDSSDAADDIPVAVTVSLAGTAAAGNYALSSGALGALADITPLVIAGTVDVDVSNTTGKADLIDEGDLLTVSIDDITTPDTLTYTCQWYRNGTAVSGATATHYTVGSLADDPAGTSFTVKVKGTGNYSGTLESAAIEVFKTPLGGSVTITGTTAPGNALTLDTSSLTPVGATYDITWQRDGVLISGANGASYTLTDADAGKTVSAVVTATGYYSGVKSASIDIPANPYVPGTGIVDQQEEVTVDLTLGSTILSPDQTNQLISMNATEPVVMSGNGYTITFPAGSMSSAGGTGSGLDMGISFNTGTDYGVIKSETGDDFVLMLEFSHSGALPGKAHISIFVGKQYVGKTMKYMYYNPKTDELETIQTAEVDKNGYITVTQDHCSSYAVALYEVDDSPKTGDSSSNLLWWLLAGISASGILAILVLWNVKRKITGKQ